MGILPDTLREITETRGRHRQNAAHGPHISPDGLGNQAIANLCIYILHGRVCVKKCVYIHMCVCIFICIYIYMYVYGSYMSTHTHMHMYIRMYICISMYMNMHMCIYVYNIWRDTYAHTQANIHTMIDTYMRTYIHTYIHTYTDISCLAFTHCLEIPFIRSRIGFPTLRGPNIDPKE